MLPIPRKALLAPAVALLVGVPAQADTQNSGDSSMAVREVIDRSFRLSPGADISVDTIAGPVTIETGDSNVAHVHIVRGAATRLELQCYRTDVSGAADRITIRHVQFTNRPGCDSIRSGQEVRLKLPRDVGVSLSTIAGGVDIGPIDGRLRLESIAGPVRARGVRSGELSSLAGGLQLTVNPPTSRGVRVSSVVGPTDITFAAGTSADVRVDSVMGNTTSTSRRIPISWSNGRASARVGSGGPPVTVSAVVGHVTLHGS